jgi:hypothetical protein
VLRLRNKKPGRFFIDLPDELKDIELIIQIILKAKTGKKDTVIELPTNDEIPCN